MRKVIWVDLKGRKHCSLVRDDDPDHLAPSGIPHDPPDLSRLDWEAIELKLHNLLVERGLYTYDDVVALQNGVTSSILSTLKREVIALYKTENT